MAPNLLNLANLLRLHLTMTPSQIISKRDNNDASTAAIAVISVFGGLVFLFSTAIIGTCVYARVTNKRFDMKGMCLRPRPPAGIPRTRATI